jgi:hypothetical protein
VRDRYGDVVAQDGEALEQFVRRELPADASDHQVQRARELLELARATMRTFTSCAWFFDEVDRIEVRQVLRYAARAIELTGHASRLMPEFVQWLAPATSGAPNAGSAGELFVREAMPHRDATTGAAAGAIACANVGIATPRIAIFDVTVSAVAPWRVTLTHRRTGAVRTFVGHVHGSGPGLTVDLSETDADVSDTDGINVHEFPESIARQLLRPMALSDEALFDEVGPRR